MTFESACKAAALGGRIAFRLGVIYMLNDVVLYTKAIGDLLYILAFGGLVP